MCALGWKVSGDTSNGKITFFMKDKPQNWDTQLVCTTAAWRDSLNGDQLRSG